ncbi:helix-turn-helix domain-containing protein [Vibrio superstes]|uniref:HTH araC/xylS-type domain-containing protein n=1 Tax=Vibrio superstes NBRC 103154 TaxID=1219062 RepID=A0A511QVG7_9VIBR|nr:AraC family transcriptional regulator [Vibrio superstes]GEM80562.1 hypothetical protein VSU01S_28070 [Vibrio superstes NBRC 103154]
MDSIQGIPLIKTSAIRPFISRAERLGIPCKHYAKQVGLDIDVIKEYNCIIGERTLWRFIELIAKAETLSFFGYDTSKDEKAGNLSFIFAQTNAQSVTLADALQQLITLVSFESSACDISIEYLGDKAWIKRRPPFVKQDGSWQMEQYVIGKLIQFIRVFSHQDWMPEALKLTSPQAPLPDELLSVEVEWECVFTEICFPIQFLSNTIDPSSIQPFKETLAIKSGPYSDISLENFVRAQVLMHRTNMDDVAEEVGISKSTLKRRLAKLGTSFSQLLEHTRFDMAVSLLESRRYSVYEIGYLLQYQYPENFMRAFKRISGLTPTEYAQKHFS